MDRPVLAQDDWTLVDPKGGGGRPVQGHELPTGMRLAEFEISRLIGQGGFGIVYLAHDHVLQRRVALKEYMPSSLAVRAADGVRVCISAPRHAEAFEAGLRSFVNEARLLAQFDDPALVKVYRFWEDHGTAYMVMPYYEGPTLKAALAQQAERPDEATIRTWLDPLLDALAVLHGAGCLHRDIAPDNILLTASGPLLLDFGAARRVIGELTHDLTVVLKPGYAPIEQYGDVPTMTQGPWTDLYALACVVYRAITGKAPMPSVERVVEDRLPLLRTVAAGRYGESLLRAMDAALAVRPQDRPQDVARLRSLLGNPARPSAPAARRPRARLWALAAIAATVLVSFAAWLAGTGKDNVPRPPDPAPRPVVTVAPAVAQTVRQLLAAWQAGDRDAALKIADPAAVDKLFRLRFIEVNSKEMLCPESGSGQRDCHLPHINGVLVFRLMETDQGWRLADVGNVS